MGLAAFEHDGDVGYSLTVALLGGFRYDDFDASKHVQCVSARY